jgi:hypothetical protein
MVGEILTFDARQIPVEQDRVLRALGYPSADAASEMVRAALPGWIDEAVEKSAPRAVFKIVDVAANGARVQVAGGPSFQGRLLAEAMVEISEAVLLLVTLGEGVSQFISELSAGRALDAVGVDAVASELVETVANQFAAMAAAAARPVLPFRTLRFSPGYCDWSINELPEVLACLDPGRIGVSLTAGGMMMPQKTIAGMAGLSASSEAATRNPCRNCPRKDCDHRR